MEHYKGCMNWNLMSQVSEDVITNVFQSLQAVFSSFFISLDTRVQFTQPHQCFNITEVQFCCKYMRRYYKPKYFAVCPSIYHHDERLYSHTYIFSTAICSGNISKDESTPNIATRCPHR